MKTRSSYLWLLPVLALSACGDNGGGGGGIIITGDTGGDTGGDTAVIPDGGTDTGGDVVTPGDNGQDVITPGDGGDDVITPGDGGDDVITPGDGGTDVITPGDGGDDVITPGDGGGDVITPGDGGDDVITPGDGGTDVPVDMGPPCPTAGQTRCGTACVDTTTDPMNCGTCATACGTGTECRGGSCVPLCPTGQILCGTPSACTDTQTSSANCGGCGTACPTGQMCVAGACSVVCTAPQTLCTAAAGTRSCANLMTDAANCGACGNACTTGQMCVAGACTVVCATGQTACGAACFDLNTSNANCGACGTACPTGESCAMGHCQRTCGTGETLCGTACVNVMTDTANCGRCTNACAMSQTCAAGTCACPTGQTLCTGACLDTMSDTRNCGTCAHACATGENCVSGACRAMPPMNDLPAGAILINLAAPSQTITGGTAGATNQSTCGAAGDVYYRFVLTAREVVYADTFGTTFDTELAFAPATGVGTIAGTCTDDSCSVLQSQLARVLDPGTYYLVVSGFGAGAGPFTLHFQHLPMGSGAITQILTLTGSQTFMGTTAGVGVLTESCTTAPGPETSYWATTCPTFAATGYTASTCGGATWDTVLEQRSASRAPLAVCNDDACGVQSTIAGTLPAGAGLHTLYVDGYAAGSLGAYTLNIRFGTCPTGQTLCGSAGCFDLTSDRTNCGACGTVCGTGLVCTASRCACPTGSLLCGGTCVTPATDRNNCGSCGHVCPAAQSCVAGACACPTGTSLCGAACVNLMTSTTNCGTCGTTCPSGGACTGGVCACPTGQTACGAACFDLTSSNTNCGVCGRACAAGNTCQTGTCRPRNNDRASAIAITLAAGEVAVSGSTVGATFDGPTGCSDAPNLWYSVTLAGREVLYADTAGSTYDTFLYIVDSTGALVAGTCDDDTGCTTGGFTSGLQSRTAAVLNAGTYFIAVSGFSGATGAFALRVQHLPTTLGRNFIAAPIAGTGSASGTLSGASSRTATCGGDASGEDVRWYVTCGGQQQFSSMCMADGGTFSRRIGTTNFDPSMYIVSGATGAEVTCNDDGGTMGGTMCTGTGVGADAAAYGSRLNNVVTARGLQALVVDERTGGAGMTYTIRYTIR